MLTSKFNLYNTEWTDRVFDDRNKAYGAYELRHNYSNTMVKAMVIAFLGVGVLFGSTLVFKTSHAVQPQRTADTTVVTLNTYVKPDEPKPAEPATSAEPVKTTEFVPMVVTPDKQAKKAVENSTLATTAIGPVTVDGPDLKGPPAIDKGPVGPPAPPAPDPEIIYSSGSVDFMPEPVGGAAAWNKFLSKNLRFPVMAQEEGVGGRVYLSFIIEKDGSLSNITVDKAAGHGFDEEALRVLKLAKAWKPGMQNGQPVRVKYSIPITFQAPEI